MRDIDLFDEFTSQINARRAAIREMAPEDMPAHVRKATAPKATAPKVKATAPAPKVKRPRKARAPRIVRDSAVEWCTERGIGRYGETTASRADARARLNAARVARGLEPLTYRV